MGFLGQILDPRESPFVSNDALINRDFSVCYVRFHKVLNDAIHYGANFVQTISIL